MVTTNERSPMAASMSAVAATCAKAPRIAHGQNKGPGRGRDAPLASITPSRKTITNGKPNRKRTWVAPTVPSLPVSSRCMALRSVCMKAAMTVKTTQSQDDVIAIRIPGPGTAVRRTASLRDGRASRRLLRDHHVVDVRVARELPAVGHKIVDDAAFAGDMQPAPLDRNLEFVRRDELVPSMGAARQPTQDGFGADYGEREALCCAIERGDEQKPAGLHHRARLRDEEADIGDMLDHFHGEHDVEPFAGLGQLLCGHVAVMGGN